jgi:hypothetical protein
VDFDFFLYLRGSIGFKKNPILGIRNLTVLLAFISIVCDTGRLYYLPGPQIFFH